MKGVTYQMVLYHLSTTYQLLYCIVHRLARHPQEEAGLFMVEYIKPESERRQFLQRLQETGWFSFVRLVPENQFKLRRGNALSEESTQQEIEAVIHNICACVENWLQLDLVTCSRIYVGSDQWSFGVYCLKNRIPHVYIEDASGMLSQRERYMQITREISKTNYVISEYLHGAGKSDCETARLCDIRNFINGFTDEKAENFSIYDALRYEIPQLVPKILAFYGVEPIMIEEDRCPVCIFMTQYLKSLAIKDLDVQEQITTILVDYFSSDCQLVIKPHPKDIWLNYRRIFPKAKILSHKINSELLPFVFNSPIKRVLTASSTSVGGMAPFAEETFAFTTEIETNHEHLHALYIAATLLKALSAHCGQPLSIDLSHINQVQLENFLKMLHVPQEENGLPIYVTGQLPFDRKGNLPEAVLIISDEEDYQGDVPFFDAMSEGGLLQIEGLLIPEEGSLLKEKRYELYFKTDNAKLARFVYSYKERRSLYFSKASLSIACKALNE